jgi:hypothetical protein
MISMAQAPAESPLDLDRGAPRVGGVDRDGVDRDGVDRGDDGDQGPMLQNFISARKRFG